MSPLRRHARVLSASLAGTAVEFYDFYIFGTAAALVFGPLFFPASSPSAQLLLAYATFGVAFVARPVGAVAFGHFGDRIGRKSTLVASLMIMGLSTFAIALLPTHAVAGTIAPLLLCLLRFGQGFGLGGEWSGAALLAVENAPEGWKGRFGCVPQLGAPLGFIASNGLFLALGLWLSPAEFAAWGWRIPFALSLVLVGIGLWVRLRLAETPAFRAAMAEAPPPRLPLGEVLATAWRAVLAGTLGVIACFAVFYLATAFALGYATTTLGLPRERMLALQLGAILFLAAGIVLAGWLADRWSPRRVLVLGCFGTMLAGALLPFGLVAGDEARVFGWLALALGAMGLVYGPVGAWLPSLFAARVRYTGTGLAFNVGGVLGGGLTPFAAQWLSGGGLSGGGLSGEGRGLAPVGLYLALAGGLSLFGLLVLARGSERDLAAAR